MLLFSDGCCPVSVVVFWQLLFYIRPLLVFMPLLLHYFGTDFFLLIIIYSVTKVYFPKCAKLFKFNPHIYTLSECQVLAVIIHKQVTGPRSEQQPNHTSPEQFDRKMNDFFSFINVYRIRNHWKCKYNCILTYSTVHISLATWGLYMLIMHITCFSPRPLSTSLLCHSNFVVIQANDIAIKFTILGLRK